MMTGGWLWVQPRRDGEQHLREEKRGQASHQVIILIAMMTIVMVIMMVVTVIMIMIIVMAVLMITHDYGDDNNWSKLKMKTWNFLIQVDGTRVPVWQHLHNKDRCLVLWGNNHFQQYKQLSSYKKVLLRLSELCRSSIFHNPNDRHV